MTYSGTRDRLSEAGALCIWPRVLLAEDLAAVFNISVTTAKRRLAAGDFGPTFTIARKRAVLREVLHATLLDASGILPDVAPHPSNADEVES